MSMMLCYNCDRLCDTDDDPDGFYCEGYEDKFICDFCRDKLETESTLDE